MFGYAEPAVQSELLHRNIQIICLEVLFVYVVKFINDDVQDK